MNDPDDVRVNLSCSNTLVRITKLKREPDQNQTWIQNYNVQQKMLFRNTLTLCSLYWSTCIDGETNKNNYICKPRRKLYMITKSKGSKTSSQIKLPRSGNEPNRSKARVNYRRAATLGGKINFGNNKRLDTLVCQRKHINIP